MKSKTKAKKKNGISRKKFWSIFILFSLITSFICVFIVYQSQAATVTHKFSKNIIDAGVIKNTTGTDGTYVNCGSDCSHTFNYSLNPITYQAYPKTFYNFKGWENSPSIRDGLDYTTNPLSVSRKRSWSLNARFAKKSDQEIVNIMVPRYTAACPILGTITVTFTTDTKGYQALSYYSSGRILVNPTHTYPIETILKHEIYHIYDYKDNGRIDWGESIPPSTQPACMASVKF